MPANDGHDDHMIAVREIVFREEHGIAFHIGAVAVQLRLRLTALIILAVLGLRGSDFYR